ncbi:TetR/AcrR family transcriptional regulator [Erwinia aphidicola]|uniref:TetR/AcrR family transcriptional regulator n=1 Tax=Erwinia aphidicola TaxID=68334 RepID=UPI0030D152B2
MRSVYQREDVLPLVAGVFRELGYDGTSISRITEKTGLGKGSLYHFSPAVKRRWPPRCWPRSTAGLR